MEEKGKIPQKEFPFRIFHSFRLRRVPCASHYKEMYEKAISEELLSASRLVHRKEKGLPPSLKCSFQPVSSLERAFASIAP